MHYTGELSGCTRRKSEGAKPFLHTWSCGRYARCPHMQFFLKSSMLRAVLPDFACARMGRQPMSDASVTGPLTAPRVPTSDQTTRVGLFAGVSVHFWKYMYLTPGFHVGQFADFPAGFTHSGQDIPPSFTGPLTPQTRTTARFAIGITFKGFNIPTGSSKSSGQVAGQSSTK